MFEIERILAWEFWRKIRGGLAVGVAVVTAFYCLVLSRIGIGLDPTERLLQARGLFSGFFFPQAALFGFLIARAQCDSAPKGRFGFPRRLLALPVQTWRLAGFHLLLAIAAAALAGGALAAIYDTMFNPGLSWVGSGATTAACCALFLAVLWSTRESLALRLGGMAAAAYLLIRLLGGRSSTYAQLQQLYKPDLLPVAAILALAFLVAGWSLRFDRRGAHARLLPAWIRPGEIVHSLLGFRPKAASPFVAQLWLEWRVRGLAFPLLYAFLWFAILVSLMISGEFIRLSEALGFSSLVAGMVSLLYLSFPIGLAVGWLGSSRQDPRMGPFRSARALSDTGVAGAALIAGFSGVVAVIFIGLTCHGIAFLAGMWSNAGGAGQGAAGKIWEGLMGPITGPGIPLARRIERAIMLVAVPWTLMAFGMVISMSGRTGVVLTSILLILSFPLAALYAPTHFPGPLSDPKFVFYIVLCALVPATAFLLWKAGLRRIFRRNALIAMVTAIGVLACLHFISLASADRMDVADLAPFIGLACLPILPIAVAPFAVGWNRHR